MANSILKVPLGVAVGAPHRTPGCLGTNCDTADINSPDKLLGDSSGPLGVNDYGAPATPAPKTRIDIRMLNFDAARVFRFLRSVSYAKACETTVEMVWVEDRSMFFRVLYTALPWKTAPGAVEVHLATEQRLKELTDRDSQGLFSDFLDKCAAGPERALSFLSLHEEVRTGCCDFLQRTFAEVNRINRDVRGETAEAIAHLARIKLASTLVIKAVGLFVPGPLATLVDLGYDISLSTIEDLSKAPKANSVGVVWAGNTVKEGAEELAGEAGEKIADKINRRATEKELKAWKEKADELEKKIEKRWKEIPEAKRTGNGRNVRRIRELEKKLDTTQRNLFKAGAKRMAAKSVSTLFLVNDLMQAFGDYSKTVRMAGEAE